MHRPQPHPSRTPAALNRGAGTGDSHFDDVLVVRRRRRGRAGRGDGIAVGGVGNPGDRNVPRDAAVESDGPPTAPGRQLEDAVPPRVADEPALPDLGRDLVWRVLASFFYPLCKARS